MNEKHFSFCIVHCLFSKAHFYLKSRNEQNQNSQKRVEDEGKEEKKKEPLVHQQCDPYKKRNKKSISFVVLRMNLKKKNYSD